MQNHQWKIIGDELPTKSPIELKLDSNKEKYLKELNYQPPTTWPSLLCSGGTIIA